MKEQPNFSYIHQLSGGDKTFEARLLNVVKRELPEEIETYQNSIAAGNLTDAAANVHKLKHKISILGLEESYRFAEVYEKELRENENVRQKGFEEILDCMLSFIKDT